MALAAVGGLLSGAGAVVSIIETVISTIRSIIERILNMLADFAKWASQHPLEALLLLANLTIWLTP